MASYRDPRYPDTLRFPGNVLPRVLIVVALFFNLVCAVLAILYFTTWYWGVFDAVLLISLTWLELRVWPCDITSNPEGLRQLNMLGREVLLLGWNEIQTLEEARELGGETAASLGLATDTLIIRGKDQTKTIVHTPRHPDRDRLRREFQTYRVTLPTQEH